MGPTGKIRELSDRLLRGETSTAEQHPFTPLMDREEVAPGVGFVSGFANLVAVTTAEGLVLIDSGSALLSGVSHGLVRGMTDAPLHTAVFTHGHIDHVGGLPPFEAEPRPAGLPPVRVLAHEAVPARFARYRLTRGYNGCVNSRQFQIPVTWPEHYREPDQTYRDRLDVQVGDTVLQLRHARGETDDHTYVYLPASRVLCTGDLFIWATPNAGNPQKVQRYPREWAQALREMAGLSAEVLCPGHGPPIFGAAAVARALSETAELLESLVAQTLALINAGARLTQVLQEVRAPAHLLARPYLRPIYDEPSFIVRNLWRLYAGWYDGNPANLKPAPEAALARELAGLCGGPDKLIARALQLIDSRDGQAQGPDDTDGALACHLAELAALAAPEDEAIRAGRAQVLRRRAAAQTSLMARGIYLAAASGE
jgi:glyoxylase-like metal-dependent hydrolase (beta-lactamase superfamily II)